MPLYEYECKDCAQQSEILVSGLRVKPDCPHCGSKKLNKLLSVVGAPVINSGSQSRASQEPSPGMCGRSQCASGGCIFDN